ncbi:hypothetical protein [Sphingomonas sp. 1P08PE]|uniref:hypothetical protein n=1 Tax=Sphingomonas sp. 1P08PE TaxID=554122 RepID=UPI00399F62B1
MADITIGLFAGIQIRSGLSLSIALRSSPIEMTVQPIMTVHALFQRSHIEP